MAKMKIAIVFQPIGTIDIHSPSASLEIWTLEVARRLARSFNVIVYVKRGKNQREFEHHEGVQYRRISARADEKFIYIASAAERRLSRFCNLKRPLFASKLYYFMYALKVAKEVKSEKCDLVHILNFSQFVPIIRAFNPKIKIVLHMTCEWLTQLDRAMIESRLEKADLILGVSHYVIEKIRRRFPKLANRCQTLLTGVDVHHFFSEKHKVVTTKNEVKNILFVGRVSPEKGLHVLLDALAEVVKSCPQAHLKIVGSYTKMPREWLVALSNEEKVSALSSFYQGHPRAAREKLSYFTELQKKLTSLNISDHVTFTGSVPNNCIVNFYRDADLLVNPSFSESFGRSLIEAMACQVPVVATRVGGMTEIVEDGRTGILVEPGDASKLAEAIIRLLSNEDLRRAMGKAGRKRVVELYSWEKIVEKLLHHYKSICEFSG